MATEAIAGGGRTNSGMVFLCVGMDGSHLPPILPGGQDSTSRHIGLSFQ
jgi:hypothetical protein